ncbi:uncharacterized protein LOC143201968 [Rhynchophorus ferrugineus]|uniref:uncharacterized protein LOC143201968 n=1 Tax=Rhynchophorus ferrugineus TaxID=354439 RepID=UPI003FCE8C0B
MRLIVYFLSLILSGLCYPLYHPFGDIGPLTYPYSYGLTYAPQMTAYSSYLPTYVNDYVQDFAASGYSGFPEGQSTLNVLAELPYSVSNQFSVVPMFVVSRNNMNTISSGKIMSVSKEEPLMTVKTNQNSTIECTPAVRMALDRPIIVGSLRSDVLFPTEIQIQHAQQRIPLKIGAVIAPIGPEAYVSQETPIAIRVVYAIPTKPLKITIIINQDEDEKTPPEPNKEPLAVAQPAQEDSIEEEPSKGFGALSTKPDYVNNENAIFVPDGETVIVESEPEVLPPKNVTIIEFPDKEAEPQMEVDEEDEELVNRNPPIALAPAGIVQSTQPQTHVEPFHNDKESSYLDTLREESKKKRI